MNEKLKDLFLKDKNVLTDEEVEKELKLGEKIIELLKDDIFEMSINFAKRIENENDSKSSY